MEINIALPNLAGRRCVHPRVQHCCDNHLDQHLPEYCQLREFLASFEQRPTTTPQWRFLIWKSILCCQIWQGLGGGVYIDGSSTVVAITFTIIYQNEASGVSFLPVLNQGPTTTPR